MRKNQRGEQEIPLPEAFVERMRGMLGADFGAFMDSYEKESAYGLRYNPLKADREHFEKAAASLINGRIPWAAEGYAAPRERQPGKQILHEAGAYYIQEPSAMSAAEALGVKEGERVLDLCAAPGGKTTQLAGKMRGTGLLAANEYVASRARILSQNVERFGIRNCVVLNEDPARLAERFPCFFHRILVDAPCSGEGMFRKDEQARGEWSGERVAACAERQLMILEHADRMLMPEGRLVYSTCTFAPAENEGVVARFLCRHPEYELIGLPEHPGADHGHPEWIGADTDAAKGTDAPDGDAKDTGAAGREALHLERCLRLWPHRVLGEGHFVAAMRKRGEAGQDAVYRPVQPSATKEAASAWRDFARENLTVPPAGVPVAFGTYLYLVPEGMRELSGLRVERAGLCLGEYKKGRFEPAHALALALRPQDAVSRMALSKECAERFLRGEALAQDGTLHGWTLLCYEGYPLGWGKASGNQIKNHYPKGLRITAWAG